MRSLPLLAASASCALLLIACGPPGSQTVCEADLLPGDLVITEVMANPDGADEGEEWFEIYNASATAVPLKGLRLLASNADLSSERFHAMRGEVIEPGAYLVVGAFPTDQVPAHADYGYDTALGTLRNTEGRLALECGAVIIDQASWASTSDGKSLSFTGALSPDYQQNDDAANWCSSSADEFSVGNFGTPGGANEICPGGPLPTTCLDAGVERERVLPATGDLVFTEIMPNPSAVADAQGEWFELVVTADVDLNSLQLGQVVGTPKLLVDSPDCLAVKAGDRLIFARDPVAATNGGLDPVFATFDFGLTNSGGTLYVGHGDVVIDTVTYGAAPTGASLSLDPKGETAAANDEAGLWCPATAAYGAGDLGTPGGANPSCPLTAPPGQCVDGDQVRDLVRPQPGDLEISEYMANPAAVADSAGEWFEIHAKQAVDLNELSFSNDLAGQSLRGGITDGACLRVAPGDHLLIARNPDSATNGGLPAAAATFSFGLLNSGGALGLVSEGQVIDALSWGTSAAGAAASRDPTTGAWCEAATPYGAGDFGSPAAANPACP